MASKSAVPLDEVIIEIKSKADGSTKSIDELAASLNNLKQSISGGFNNLNKLSKTLGELPTLMNKFDTTTFENLKRVSNELAQSLEPLANKMNQIAQGYSAFSKIQNTFGKSASTSTRYMKQQKSMLVALSNVARRSVSSFVKLGSSISTGFGKKAVSDIKKFNSQFKQIFLSLLGTRTLFTMIRKAAAEYEAFDETLQKFSTNVWRAFGAQLAPIIEYTMELFKQFVRVIYSIVYALTGIDLIAKANAKAMAAWGKSSKDTLGNLQKFDDLNVVEFDKNKSGDDKSLIELDKIDLSPIQKVIDWVRKLKKEIQEAWNSGEWYGVGEVFAEGISMGINYVVNNMDKIRNKLFDIVGNFTEFLNGAIEGTNWGLVGTFITETFKLIPDTINKFLLQIKWSNLGEGINDTLKNINFKQMVHSFMEMIGSLASGLVTLFLEIEWDQVAANLGEAIATFFSDLSSIINSIPWKTIGQKVREAIENVPWADVWKSIISTASSFVSGANDFISGLTGIDVSSLQAIEKSLVGIGIALTTYKIVKNLSSMFTILSNGINTISKVGGYVDKFKVALFGLSENPLLTGKISSMTSLKGVSGIFGQISASLGGASFGTVAAVIAAVVVAVMALVTAFKELYTESEPFRNTVNELITSIKDTLLGILETLIGAVIRIKDSLVNAYNEILKPLWDILVDVAKVVLEPLMEILNILWKTIIEPIANFLQTVFTIAIEYVCEAFDFLVDVLAPVIDVLSWLWKHILKPIVDFLLDIVVGAVQFVGDIIGGVINTVTVLIESIWTVLKKTWDTIWGTIKKVGTLIYGVVIKPIADNFVKLKNDIVKAWEDVKKGISNVWKGIKSVMKTTLNWLISKFENFLNNMISGINGLSSGLRKIGNKVFDIIGVDIKFNPISTVSLPRLETGTNEIPYEGVYHLHPGEAVVPKKYNPALGGGTNAETNEKLDRLIFIMENMDFTNVVNIGNERVYAGQQKFNKYQQNKYGTINIY